MDSTFFVNDIATELAKELRKVIRRAYACRSIAEQLKQTVDGLLPIVQEIRYSGVELPQARQFQLSELARQMNQGIDLTRKAAELPRWNVYRSVQLAKKMENIERWITKWTQRQMPAHVLADVHCLRVESDQRISRIERQIGQLAPPPLGLVIGHQKGEERESPGEIVNEITMREKGEERESGVKEIMMREKEEEREGEVMGMMMREKEEEREREGLLGERAGGERVKEMVMRERGDKWGLVGISGIGGSGKTTLAKEICKDFEIKAHFKERIYFETVSQSPNLETLKLKLYQQITNNVGPNNLGPNNKGPILIILDDIWDINQLEELIIKMPNIVYLVVSRFKFPNLIFEEYEMELLGEQEALSLFCRVAFEQENIPVYIDKKLVKQVVAECKGLPLAIKVIGASLHGQKSAKIWQGAKNRLSRGESISDSHEIRLLQRMATSIECLSKKVRECFLDLGCFPEDKKIALDLLMNIWMETHDLDEEDAFAILVELSNKNLLTLVKDTQDRAGDLYSCYNDLSITQHDVLRDLAIYIGNSEPVNNRKRIVMPRKEDSLPREWERNKNNQFDAQIVSIHTGEMKESDWFEMNFPKAEVLIINFSSKKYYLPPFITNMPTLKTLILINSYSNCATLENLTIFTTLDKTLKTLYLEKLTLPPIPKTTIPLKALKKLSIMQCESKNILKNPKMEISITFPKLSNLTLDHCFDLKELPSSICDLNSLTSLTISNCHDLLELPSELGRLGFLEIFRVYACPNLKRLPKSIGGFRSLKYLDISQCINMMDLPEELGRLVNLEKLDMRECSQLKTIPKSYSKLKSLGHVVCDEDMALFWKEAEREIPDLRIQIAEECYNLDWIAE